MELRLLNHSCLQLRHGSVNLVMDPWMEGRVFLDGWDLLCPTPFKDEEFSTVSHIWISHEHPDHFHPPTLKRISPEHRSKIAVLIPRTPDGRMARFLRAQGFERVVEMSAGTKVELGSGVTAQCALFGEIDSWLYVNAEGRGVLNTNDCGIRTPKAAREIRQMIEGPIDILLTQFSYAYWKGNPGEKKLREEDAARKLDYVNLQIEVFKPRQVVPIASLVWFCHEENFYLNDSVNTPRSVFESVIKQGLAEPVVLFPGETLSPLRPHDSASSIARYDELYARVVRRENCVKGNRLGEEKLKESASRFLARLRSLAPRWLLGFLRPTHVHVSDWNRTYRLGLAEGFVPCDLGEEFADVSCSSESLEYCFKFSWGIDTQGINGRYRRPPRGNYQRFYTYFRFDLLNERGIQVGPRYVFDSIFRKALTRLGLHTP